MQYPAFDKRVGPFDKGHQQHPDRGQRSASYPQDLAVDDGQVLHLSNTRPLTTATSR
ncbi:hypothetical protein [Streptomyces sp. CC210A]|uniref:hypothetical protein n=1 Tax=Streptomyces sp. CC210A TaxID=2898184 RepID=UPI001F26BB88|nr:hypothetical protein [Streptomyces sp. CC210A]